MLCRDPLPFLRIASKQNGDGVQVRAGEPAYPAVRMIDAGITEDLRTRDHALSELFGKGRERRLVNAKCA